MLVNQAALERAGGFLQKPFLADGRVRKVREALERATAPAGMRSATLENRVDGLGVVLQDVRDALDVLTKRTVPMQAQHDHLAGRIDRG
jgi:hypothetical protein